MTVGTFEEDLQLFMNTIYGYEMKGALVRCFSALYEKIEYCRDKIQAADNKITEVERG